MKAGKTTGMRLGPVLGALLAVVGWPGVARGDDPRDAPRLAARAHLVGAPQEDVVISTSGAPDVRTRMGDLWREPRAPAPYSLRFALPRSAGVVVIPSCGHRGVVEVGDRAFQAPDGGPFEVPVGASEGPRALTIAMEVSTYERRIACGFAPRFVASVTGTEGGAFFDLVYASPHRRACRGACEPGRALVYIPSALAGSGAGPLLVGVHPWNGSRFTYAAYRTLIDAAEARGVMLLLPDGLGNSLYTADAEDEVMRAIAALAATRGFDPARTSIWGASMGGQGATTIAFHHPDAFAFVGSFFGDARFDRRGYVRTYFPTDASARLVNPADAGDNARELPTWLIHGDADRTSPVRESVVLHRELAARGYPVRFDKVPGRGHEGRLVEDFVPMFVQYASTLRRPSAPSRVTYVGLRPGDMGAYGVRLERRVASAEAAIDVAYEASSGRWTVYRADNVTALALRHGAFGYDGPLPITVSDGGRSLVLHAEDAAAP